MSGHPRAFCSIVVIRESTCEWDAADCLGNGVPTKLNGPDGVVTLVLCANCADEHDLA